MTRLQFIGGQRLGHSTGNQVSRISLCPDVPPPQDCCWEHGSAQIPEFLWFHVLGGSVQLQYSNIPAVLQWTGSQTFNCGGFATTELTVTVRCDPQTGNATIEITSNNCTVAPAGPQAVQFDNCCDPNPIFDTHQFTLSGCSAGNELCNNTYVGALSCTPACNACENDILPPAFCIDTNNIVNGDCDCSSLRGVFIVPPSPNFLCEGSLDLGNPFAGQMAPCNPNGANEVGLQWQLVDGANVLIRVSMFFSFNGNPLFATSWRADVAKPLNCLTLDQVLPDETPGNPTSDCDWTGTVRISACTLGGAPAGAPPPGPALLSLPPDADEHF